MTQYDVGLLIGRAFALANGAPATSRGEAVDELRTLADGDSVSLQMARARFLEFVDRDPDASWEDRRALALLDEALAADGVHRPGQHRPPPAGRPRHGAQRASASALRERRQPWSGDAAVQPDRLSRQGRR